jgi:PAS domain S-box-containing protein
LQERVGQFRIFFENIEDSIFELDLRGRFTLFNPSTCRNLGYPPDELRNLPFHARYASQEEVDETFKIFNQVYRTGVAARIAAHKTMTKQGEAIYSDVIISLIREEAGNPTGFRCVSRDVTKNVQTQEALRKSEERYRLIAENITNVITIWDVNLNMTYVSPSIERLRGFTVEETLRQTIGQILVPESQERAIKAYTDLLTQESSGKLDPHTMLILEFEEYRKDGSTIWVEDTLSILRDQDQKTVGILVMSRDVTERKQAEAEKARLEEQLQQAEKLEAIGTLAGGIAHDFNNLLMGIQGYASLIMLDTDLYHPHFEMLKAIEAQVKSGADLTRQLLAYAQGGRYVVEPISLNELAGRTLSMFARTRREIHTHERYEPDLWRVACDQGQMEQVFLNLFVNASQAMPGGGALFIETQNVYLDEDYVKPFDMKPGPYVKVSFTDTGMGMDDATRKRIFEPFFTTKEMGRGAGLGLASVYGIVKGHRGNITVYSEKGHGATFNLYLPAADTAEIPPRMPPSESPAGRGTILIVDDEKTIRKVTAELLERIGYDVMVAEGGMEAVSLYRENQDRIDLVIMDMVMPEMGGGEAIDRIREINPAAKIILASGYSINGEAKDILERGGAQEFIQKPFHLKDLSDKIQELLKK